MNIIFCEECGSRNVIEDEALQNIDSSAIPCQICGFEISTEHLINHTGVGRVINTSTYKLLIIDDDKAHLNLLQVSLQKEYTVSVAASGLEGIAAAVKQDPDLILMDVSMPGLDGYEVCSQLKSNKKTRHIPIIFVTAKTKGDDEYKGLSLGAVDYIFKPFNIKILNAKIASHLKFNAMQEELKKKISEQEQYIEILKSEIIEEYTPKQEKDDENTARGGGDNRYIEQENQNLINVINTLRDHITIQDMNGKILWANKATMKAFDVNFSSLQGKKCYNFYCERDSPCVGCVYGDGTSKSPSEPVEVYNTKLGQTFLQTSLALPGTDGKIVGVACTAQLVDALKPGGKAEEKVVGPSIGDFLETNYSELNDVISTLLISSDTMCNMYREDKNLFKINEYIGDASKRLRILFNQLRKNSEEK
ncbi:response regulator [Desulforhopalus sp. IMCC35007]|uniref:response regulator n=1 Tax=Desulforhopalus sp. IMCC35007 TaxID=2569543 RepID=UPI0010AE438B|nr:response regulator [Desulforhopalus sp. IMCC35007]TKB06101.1 response regulator [Desulforhopalus sp. IMCC35007]